MRIGRLILTVVTAFTLLACNPPPQSSEVVASKEDSGNVKDNVPRNCQLTLGFDVWEPYQYVDVAGRIGGLDIELISAVAEQMECDINFQQGTWVSSLEKLKNGQVDILLGASKTESREQFALFSESYRTEEFSLYIRKGDKKRAAYDSIATFVNNNSRIGIVDAYFYGPEVSMLLDGSATSKFFVTSIMGELNVARLLDEDIDAFLEDSFIGASILRRKALSEYITAHGLTINTGEIYVMFSKKTVSDELLTRFNTALDEVKNSKQYEEILSRYSR